jgi:hypothetical protein
MAEERETDDISRTRFFPHAWIPGVLWAFVVLSLLLIPLIFFLPAGLFWFIGNSFEVIAAVYCMLCCLYMYRFLEDRVILSLTAFAFFGYALSNLFWYVYSVTFGRSGVYISVAEIGFFCFYLFLIAAITIEFPKRKVPAVLSGLLLLLLVVLVLTMAVACAGQPLRIVLSAVSLILVVTLIDTTIRHGVFRYPLLGAGIVLSCTADIIYVVRETLVINSSALYLPGPAAGESITLYHFFSIVGPLMVISFALIVLGLFSLFRKDCKEAPLSRAED